MSSIVARTFKRIEAVLESKREDIILLEGNYQNAIKYAVDSDIAQAIESASNYSQGDIEFLHVNSKVLEASKPTIEYRFRIKGARLGITELRKLGELYKTLEEGCGNEIYVPVFKFDERIGAVKIEVGTEWISIGGFPSFQKFLILAEELEKIVKNVYGKK